jgi:hypothetical protein
MVIGVVAAGLFGVGVTPAQAAVSRGYACGYWSNVSLFGGPYGSQGCPPQSSGYATANSLSPAATWEYGVPKTVTDNNGAKATYGPAVMVSSPYDPNDNLTNTGQLSAKTSGTTTVSAQAKAIAVGPSPFWTQTPSSAPPYAEPAKSASYDGTIGFVRANCSASSSTTKSGSVKIKNGRVDVSTDADGSPTKTVVVPDPTPRNYRVDFTIDNVGDHGYIIFNERIKNADGSLTVNASHMYMQGPIALGEVIIGQVKCGHA